MEDLFRAALATNEEFKKLRDAPHHAETRKWLNSLWEKFRPYADSGFPNKVARNFHPRFWEMYIACALLDAGKVISSDDAGPDVCVQTDGPPIWVEAIAPNAGTGEDAAPAMLDDGQGGQVDDDGIVLRLRGAIESKHKAYERYIQKEIVGPSDPYIIAVNGCDVPLHQTDDEPSYIVQALYPFGMHSIKLDPQTEEIVGQEFQHRPAIYKVSGAPVSTTVFEDGAYSGISAVIYSSADAWTIPEKLGGDFQLLHNPKAKNPIERGWLKLGRERRATETELASEVWSD